MKTFYSRPDPNAFLVPGLFFLVGLSQVAPPFYGHSPGGAPVPPVWDTDTVGRFCLGLASLAAIYYVWPRPYWVQVSERGIRRVYGAGFWGDHTTRRFSVPWEDLREWYVRTESIQSGDECGLHDFVYICDSGGRTFCLGGFSTEIRDELRRWAPEKERSAELGAAADRGTIGFRNFKLTVPRRC